MKNCITIGFLFFSLFLAAQEEMEETLFVPDSKAFEVYFSTPPTKQIQKMEEEVDHIMYILNDGDTVYYVSETKNPVPNEIFKENANKDTFFNSMVEGFYDALSKGSGQDPDIEVNEQFLYDDKYSSVKTIGKAGPIELQTLFIAKENTLYQIICMGIGKKPNPEDSKKFFNSFKFLN